MKTEDERIEILEKKIKKNELEKKIKDGEIIFQSMFPVMIGAGLAWGIGAKSSEAKEFHTQGMYSEEEVKALIGMAYSETGTHSDLMDWFEQNKKKP